jgi:hypothetical protein
MEDLIIKLAKGEKVTDKDIEYSDLTAKSVMEYARNGNISEENLSSELYEICEREHSSCNSGCPVYKLNGNSVPSTKPFEENRGCDCFKHGSEMLKFIRNNS